MSDTTPKIRHSGYETKRARIERETAQQKHELLNKMAKIAYELGKEYDNTQQSRMETYTKLNGAVV